MIKISFDTHGDRGEYTGTQTVGYFNSEKEARKALRGLCPWDFNSMWGSDRYHNFKFEEIPGKLTNDDKKFIEDRNLDLALARKHAEKTAGSWCKRAPKDW